MSLAGLLAILDDDPQLHDVVSRAEYDTESDSGPAAGAGAATLAGEDLVAPPTLRPVLAAALTRRAGGADRFVLAVTATAREADDLTAALGSFLPAGSVACFPGWETLPHERLSPQSDTVGRRIAVLRRLAHPAERVSRTGRSPWWSPRRGACCSPSWPAWVTWSRSACTRAQACELDDLLTRLVEIGYSRVDLVDHPR